MIASIFSAFICTIGFAVIFHTQKKHLVTCGLVGAIGWAIYLFIEKLSNDPVIATFIASLVITSVSYLLSKNRKTPITVFLISGIIPLVPGVGLYRTMYALLQLDYSAAADSAALTFQLAGVIAGAIVIISLVPLLWRKPRR